MTLYKWSQISAADATADSSINWQEGQAPSSVNDSARAMMAAIAKYRDDSRGNIVTGGTSTAYTATSNQGYSSTSDLNGASITFIAGATNGANATLSVDGLTAYPLVSTLSTPLPAGTLIANSVYRATFYLSAAEFRLHGFFGNPYNIPIGGGIDYWGSTVPNSNFAFPIGQAISRTTYASLFAILGTIYGAGDGSTTFNLPDKTGRVSAMKETSAARLTSTYFGGNSANLGATGGSESDTLSLAQLPTGITSAGTNTINVAGNQGNMVQNNGSINTLNAAGGSSGAFSAPGLVSSFTPTASGSNAINVISNNTSGAPHKTVQPTIICNYVIRII